MSPTRLAVALAAASALALTVALPSAGQDSSLEWIGTWDTTYGAMVVNADGSGTYDYCNGTLQGSISGSVYQGTWSQVPGCSNAEEPTGTFKFTITTDEHFEGDYAYTSTPETVYTGGWNGTKTDTPAPTGRLFILIAPCGSENVSEKEHVVVRPPCRTWSVTAGIVGPSDIDPYGIDIEDAVAPASPAGTVRKCPAAGRYAAKHPRATCLLVRGTGADAEHVQLKGPPPSRAMTVHYRAVLRKGRSSTIVRTSRVVTVVVKKRK